jgi:hypothetical protein
MLQQGIILNTMSSIYAHYKERIKRNQETMKESTKEDKCNFMTRTQRYLKSKRNKSMAVNTVMARTSIQEKRVVNKCQKNGLACVVLTF